MIYKKNGRNMSIGLDESARAGATEGPAEPNACLSTNLNRVPATSCAESSIARKERTPSRGLFE